MSELTKLLEVVQIEWRAIEDYIAYVQPTKYLVKSKNYNNDFETPVLTAGKTFILGYTDEIEGIYKAKIKPVIIFDDFTTANKWVDFDFKAKSSAMKILVAKDENRISLKYFFYLLNSLPSELVAGDHKRQWISNYANKLIPIPCPDNPEKSLKIQQEIVRILDRLSEETNQLTTALQKELQIHKKRYDFYREELFKFEGKEVEWKNLGEVSKVLRGRRLTKSQLTSEGYPVYHGGLEPLGFYHEFNRPSESVMIINVGASAGNVGYSSNDFWSSDGCYCLKQIENLNTKYLFYFLLSQEFYLKSKVRYAGIPTLDSAIIEKIKIPIPCPRDLQKSLEIQKEIVQLLDQFDEATITIAAQLKKEIALRNKQYQYYRDRLLSFQSLQTEVEAIQ